MVVREEGRTLLRLSNEVGNRGAGPLEVFPSAGSDDCDGDADPGNDRAASQRVFADSDGSGSFDRDLDGVYTERRFGCLRYHPAHDHWHTLDFASYELRRESSQRLISSLRKVGFCIADHRRAFEDPAAPTSPTYPFGAMVEIGCDAMAVQGLSIGWADLYGFALPGQSLDVEGLRGGHYCLVSRADPRDLLLESNEENNVRRVRIRLRPRRLEVEKLDRPCSI